jgi:Asp-tRNA(Asn)/Glu-tRNA(Gln) amidotransferase A subunit family amidase
MTAAAEAGPLARLAAAVGAGRVTAAALVAEALARIERRDGELNAVVALRVEQAQAEAERLDAALRAGARPGPLAGVPVLVKDLEDVAGMPTRKGSRLFADAPPALADGLVPARLRAAGAIVVGKTNLPELATEGFTANLLHGVTRNPWDPRWSPGGSSGGSAAALAAGMVPVATATDGGGSIRIPAAFCGLVGLKPTHGVVGRHPVPDWIDLSTDGPLATSVADLALLLDVVRGPVAGDPDAAPGPPPAVAPAVRLLAAERTSDLGPLPAAVAGPFRAAVDAFAGLLGLPVRWMAPGEFFGGPPGSDPDLDWFTLATAEHVAALGRDRVLAGMPLLHPATAAFLADGLEVGIDEYLAARRRRFGYVARMDALLAGDPQGGADHGPALLLTPTVAAQGFAADGRLDPDDGTAEPGMLPPEVFSTAVQNMTGHPAVSLPAGHCPNGLPFGLQVTGRRHGDTELLALAHRWERAYPWRQAVGDEPFVQVLQG